jgi:hypothetical protein
LPRLIYGPIIARIRLYHFIGQLLLALARNWDELILHPNNASLADWILLHKPKLDSVARIRPIENPLILDLHGIIALQSPCAVGPLIPIQGSRLHPEGHSCTRHGTNHASAASATILPQSFLNLNLAGVKHAKTASHGARQAPPCGEVPWPRSDLQVYFPKQDFAYLSMGRSRKLADSSRVWSRMFCKAQHFQISHPCILTGTSLFQV